MIKRSLFFLLGGLILLLFFVWSGGTLDLGFLRNQLGQLVSEKIHRRVEIKGEILLHFTPAPSLSLTDLEIPNPQGFAQGTFLRLRTGRIGVRLFPLFAGKLHIPELSLTDVELHLMKDSEGAGNWMAQSDFASSSEREQRKNAESEHDTDRQKQPLADDSLVIDSLVLKNIIVIGGGPQDDHPQLLKFDSTASLQAGQPFRISGEGSLRESRFSLELKLSSLAEFLAENRTLMQGKILFSGGQLSLNGLMDIATGHERLDLRLDLQGTNLADFDRLLNCDLPPLKDYQLRGDLSFINNRAKLSDFLVRVGHSSLTGTANIDVSGPNPYIAIDVLSKQIQLDDFLQENWSWFETTDEAARENQPIVGPEVMPRRRLLSPEILTSYDVYFQLVTEKVLSGSDELGNGSLEISLADGKLEIGPLAIHIPAGALHMNGAINVVGDQLTGRLRAEMQNFDIGVVARRNDPEATLGGLVNLDLDLKGTGSNLKALVENGSGYIDFSGQLKNIGSGVVDLWAVNLVRAAVMGTVGKKSSINCGVGRWSARNGLLTPDVFFIDTTGIRICGIGKVDLASQQVDMLFSPVAKRAQFYSLAVPVSIKGGFDDIRMRVPKTELIGTTITFFTSPIHVPLQWILEPTIPADGRDACSLSLGPHDRNQKVQGCFRENSN